MNIVFKFYNCKLLCMQLYQTPPPPLGRKYGTETNCLSKTTKEVIGVASLSKL